MNPVHSCLPVCLSVCEAGGEGGLRLLVNFLLADPRVRRGKYSLLHLRIACDVTTVGHATQ